MVQIQAALDTLDFQHTLAIARAIAPYVDIIELGTPCIKFNGIRIVEEMIKAVPKCKVLADLKTMDAGYYEAAPFFRVGADIVTVLGASDAGTIAGVVSASKQKDGVMTGMAQVDLISIDNKFEKAFQAEALGAHILGIHTGLDEQAAGRTPFKDLNSIVRLGLSLKISVAGGITKETVRQVIDAGAHIVVSGAYIYGADNPVRAAAELREEVERAA